MRKAKLREGLKEIDGVVVNDNEGGTKFYHKHLAPKARAGKKKDRRQRKASRRRNRK